MNLFSIFGNPVSHSFSPKIHNACFDKFNLNNCAYIKTLVEDPKDLKKTFLELNLSGANITVPHKEEAFKICDEVRGIAKEIGAVNTIILEDDKLIGYNTDALGFYTSIKERGNFKNALIFGAGGTAKAISLQLKSCGINVVIVNRSKNRLEEFKKRGFVTYSWDDFLDQKFDLIINTTSAGLKDSFLPAPKEILDKVFKNKPFVVDVVYGKSTPFLDLAKECNLNYCDGSLMLIWQGVFAFENFTDLNGCKDEIFSVMKDVIAL